MIPVLNSDDSLHFEMVADFGILQIKTKLRYYSFLHLTSKYKLNF